MAEHDKDTDGLRYWLALLRAPRLGSRTFAELLTHFGTPQAVFAAPSGILRELGLKWPTLEYLRAPDWVAAERDLQWLAQDDAHLITQSDPCYPALLREIPDPPPALFLRGQPGALQHAQLAMVGSRSPTPAGRQTAHEFAAQLAAAGLAITSGLALGIDAACHEGALAVGGCTLAVAGTGLDRVYPARHLELARTIVAKGGALVSEFPPGTPPVPQNFPRRNRIISGMSLGTLVVEAALHSGSLITARLAAEQGREVFALPGSIHSPQARGCNALIRQGAKLVETAVDVMEELGALHRFVIEQQTQWPAARSAPPAGETLDDAHRSVLDAVGYEPTPVDTVVERSGLTAEAVCSMLVVLELQGYIASTSSGQYCRAATRI